VNDINQTILEYNQTMSRAFYLFSSTIVQTQNSQTKLLGVFKYKLIFKMMTHYT